MEDNSFLNALGPQSNAEANDWFMRGDSWRSYTQFVGLFRLHRDKPTLIAAFREVRYGQPRNQGKISFARADMLFHLAQFQMAFTGNNAFRIADVAIKAAHQNPNPQRFEFWQDRFPDVPLVFTRSDTHRRYYAPG
jgi:hypothetical protein